MKIHFLLRSDKPTKNGLPIRCHVNYFGEHKFGVGRSIDPNSWDSKRQRSKGNTKEDATLNELLNSIEVRLTTIYKDLLYSGKAFNVNDIRAAYESGETLQTVKVRHTLQEAIEDYIATCQNGVSKSRTYKWVQLKKQLALYLKETTKKETIYIDQVSLNFVNKWECWMQKNLHQNTINIYLKMIKAVMKYADISLKWIDKNELQLKRVSNLEHDREKLSEDELNKIATVDLSIYDKEINNFGNQKEGVDFKHLRPNILELVRDGFMFMAYTGLSYVDASAATQVNIIKRKGNGRAIANKRVKSDESFYTPLFDQAEEILNKYKKWSQNDPQRRLMPFISNQKMNDNLKVIATAAGVKRIKVTCHTARHTFASLAINNGVPVEIVQKILGHSKIETTLIYAKIKEARIDEAMEAWQYKKRSRLAVVS